MLGLSLQRVIMPDTIVDFLDRGLKNTHRLPIRHQPPDDLPALSPIHTREAVRFIDKQGKTRWPSKDVSRSVPTRGQGVRLPSPNLLQYGFRRLGEALPPTPGWWVVDDGNRSFLLWLSYRAGEVSLAGLRWSFFPGHPNHPMSQWEDDNVCLADIRFRSVGSLWFVGEAWEDDGDNIRYRARGDKCRGKWRSGSLLSVNQSRFLLETSLHCVHRLSGLTREDAVREGFSKSDDPVAAFCETWDTRYSGVYATNKDPWVAAYDIWPFVPAAAAEDEQDTPQHVKTFLGNLREKENNGRTAIKLAPGPFEELL